MKNGKWSVLTDSNPQEFPIDSKDFRFFRDFCGKFFRMSAFAGMTSFPRKPESGVSAKQIRPLAKVGIAPLILLHKS